MKKSKEEQIEDTLRDISELTIALLGIKGSYRHHGDGGDQICCNVKRYRDGVDIHEIAEEVYYSQVKKGNEIFRKKVSIDMLIKHYDDAYLSRIYDEWIEDCYESFLTQVNEGANYNTDSFRNGWLDKIRQGFSSGSSDVDAKKSVLNKIIKCFTLTDELAYEKEMYSEFDVKEIGIMGRSGGWLYFYDVQKLKNKIDELEELHDELKKAYEDRDIDEAETIMMRTDFEEMVEGGHKLHDAIYFMIEKIEEENKSMNFKEYLKDHIVYNIDDVIEQEAD